MIFSWNYLELGHEKGSPDGMEATCKRTSDKIITQKADITNLYVCQYSAWKLSRNKYFSSWGCSYWEGA